jgi:putative glycosyltransferase
MKISVVTSLYNSARHIDELYARASRSLLTITPHFEVILVNDGSPDTSLAAALALQAREPARVKVIDLSRNFGQHKALLTGLRHASGDLIFMMDSDLEEEPELIQSFYDVYAKASGEVDLIFGIQTGRRGSAFRRFSGHLFYKLFNLLSPMPAPENPTPFRLMTRRYVDALLSFSEREVFFLGLSLLTGFSNIAVPIVKHSSSQSSYSLALRVAQFVDAVTSFSNRPLTFIFYSGLLMSVVSCVGLALILVQYVGFGIGVSGWTSLVVSIWLVGGILVFSLGVIGIYLSKIYLEVKQRPLTIIKKIYE